MRFQKEKKKYRGKILLNESKLGGQSKWMKHQLLFSDTLWERRERVVITQACSDGVHSAIYIEKLTTIKKKFSNVNYYI